MVGGIACAGDTVRVIVVAPVPGPWFPCNRARRLYVISVVMSRSVYRWWCNVVDPSDKNVQFYRQLIDIHGNRNAYFELDY